MNLHISEAWAAIKEFMSAKATIICTHCGADLYGKTREEQHIHLEEHHAANAKPNADEEPARWVQCTEGTRPEGRGGAVQQHCQLGKGHVGKHRYLLPDGSFVLADKPRTKCAATTAVLGKPETERRCTLRTWHKGDHHFTKPKPKPKRAKDKKRK